MSITNDLKYKFGRLSVFEKIIAVNIAVFIMASLLRGFSNQQTIFSYIALPSDFFEFIKQPWSLITYGFLHFDFIHVVFNLLVLYFISKLILNLFSSKLALNIYLLGIIFGGLAFLLVYNVVPKTYLINASSVVGASAGIRALLIFLGVYMSHTEVRFFTFNVKLKYVALVLVAIDILGLFGLNQGGNIAHLGGALLGFFYASSLQKGKDIGIGFEKFMNTVTNIFKSNKPLRTVYRKSPKKSTYAGKSKDEFNTYNDQKKVDLILDKISKSGYESLTSEEKQFLFRAGKN